MCHTQNSGMPKVSVIGQVQSENMLPSITSASSLQFDNIHVSYGTICQYLISGFENMLNMIFKILI